VGETSFDLMSLFWMLVRIIAIFAGVMTMVPILIWMERKVVAMFQFRIGPNRLGPFGAMQPLADALKLIMKEDITPAGVDRFIYFLAPLLAMVPALLAAAVIPFGPASWTRITDLNHSVLYTFLLASLGVYAITLAGWASNNKYSLMGALRSAAQMISYELGMGLSLITVVMLTGTFSLREIVEQQHLLGWNVFRAPTMFIAFLVFFIAGIAETNRAPFDLAEAETELVAGFHTEYSSFKFAMFFMAEYVNMVIFSAIATTLFMGGWSGPGVNFQPAAYDAAGALVTPATVVGGWPFVLLGVFYFVAKIFFFLFTYMWIRATLPRFRYDQLMNFGWKRLVPISLANIFLVAMFIAWRRDWF
jgi:NADH-quinone oxidoreductase subunit H